MVIFLITLTFICIAGYGQTKYHPNQLIVQGELKIIQAQLEDGKSYRLKQQWKIQTISASLNAHLIGNIPDNDLEDYMELLAKNDQLLVSYDYYVNNRRDPNDPIASDQWYLRRIEALSAWNETTGGEDLGGRIPVVAVLDDGYDNEHEDLADNLYLNTNEVPDNGVDDDNNGYVDDYQGLNIISGNDVHERAFHGTAVSGIIGASSDNGIGMAGVNWDSKLLLISGIETKSGVIISAEYIYNMRKRYNETNGQEGAYIVINNYSGGIDDEWADDHPIWCQTYDLMGSVGVLSIGATTNRNVDIAETGDMPSTCSSDYLVTVHSTDQNDQRINSGYGFDYIDIGAPGVGIISLALGDQYRIIEGTSAATPLVAGVASLLYSVPCDEFYNLSLSDPAMAALTVKEALIKGSDPVRELVGTTRSGGRLNALGAMIQLSSLCGQEASPLSIESITYNQNIITIAYTANEILPYTMDLTAVDGKVVYSSDFTTELFGKREIEIPNYIPSGLYFARIYGEEGAVAKAIFISNN